MQKATLQLSVRLTLLLAAVCMVFLMIGGSADAEGPDIGHGVCGGLRRHAVGYRRRQGRARW